MLEQKELRGTSHNEGVRVKASQVGIQIFPFHSLLGYVLPIVDRIRTIIASVHYLLVRRGLRRLSAKTYQGNSAT